MIVITSVALGAAGVIALVVALTTVVLIARRRPVADTYGRHHAPDGHSTMQQAMAATAAAQAARIDDEAEFQRLVGYLLEPEDEECEAAPVEDPPPAAPYRGYERLATPSRVQSAAASMRAVGRRLVAPPTPAPRRPAPASHAWNSTSNWGTPQLDDDWDTDDVLAPLIRSHRAHRPQPATVGRRSADA